MDVPALSLLQQEKRNLQKLSNPLASDITFDQYETNIRTTMSSTQGTIHKVSVYAVDILNELDNIRETVKLYRINIGKQLKELSINHFLKEPVTAKVAKDTQDVSYTPGRNWVSNTMEDYGGYGRASNPLNVTESVTSTPRSTKEVSSPLKGLKGNDFDKKKVNQAQRLLTLAQKQQDLMVLIAKTETLASNIRTNGDILCSDAMGIFEQIIHLRESIKIVEEEIRRLNEENEQEEISKREKEEAERRKIEEENKNREKKEAERKQKEREKLEEKERRLKEEKDRKEKTKLEKENAKRRQKEKEERIKREKEETKRRQKEEAENAKREKEEIKRRQKEEAENAKRENEKAERQKREIEEKAKREKEEIERKQKEKIEQAKRDKEETERRQQDEERAKQEKEEAERKLKEKEEQTKRDKVETERRQKEEERKKREKEEAERKQKEKEEIARREKEEAKRRRAELEKLKAEEQRRMEEEEAKRRDWKNWPPYVYYNSRRNRFNHDICCVVLTMPDGITQEQLICTAFDDERHLDICIESNDEQIISSLITIKSTNDNIKFEMPIRVYVPVVTHDRTLVSTLKFTIEDKKWGTGKPLPEVQIPNVLGVTFVGVEIPIKQLGYVNCVAVARHKCDETEVDENGKVFEPDVDRNIKVKFPPKAFHGKTIVETKASPWLHNDIKSASKKYKELKNIKIAGSYINIACANVIAEDSELEMYDFGWVLDKNMQQNQSVKQETIDRCSRWLVNHMNLDENALSDVFDSDFVEELKTQESHGDKNRHILRKLHNSNESDFNKFVDSLKSTQINVADKIIQVQTQVHLSRKIAETTTEDEVASDFDPDFEKKEGTLRIVSKVTGRLWEIVPVQVLKDHVKARFVKLPSGHSKFEFFGLVVPEGMSDEDICRAAEILEGLNCVTNVSVICRQNHANPHDVIIQCVKTEDLHDTLQELDALGYNYGPAESSEFGVVDGEEIEIKVEPNLCFSKSSLKINFFKHLSFDRFSGTLSVVNKLDQLEGEKYHGSLTYYVPPGRLSLRRQGSVILYVPKPLEEIICNFPYTLDVPVKAIAKFISWQLTKDNFNSTRWVKLAGYLTDGDQHVYHQIIQRVDDERKGAPQRERCEMFILYWANGYTQYENDKIEKIITSHHDQSLEADARLFIKPYMPGKGLLSNDNLEKMACLIANDWQTMAKKMGFSSEEISKIINTQTTVVKQTIRMLDTWRLSDSTIQAGTDLIKVLDEAAKSAQCGAKLISMISNYV